MQTYTDAALSSANRALGAFLAHDAFWYHEQLNALSNYRVLTRQAQAALPGLLQAASAAVSGVPAMTIAQVQTALQTLLTQGFSQENLLQFAQVGLTPAQIEQIQALIGTRNPALIAGSSLTEILVRPDIVEALSGTPAVSLRAPVHGCWSVTEWVAQPASCPLTPQPGAADPLSLEVTFVYLGGDDTDASYPITAANFPPVVSYSNGSRAYCTLLDANGDGRLDAICDYYHDVR